MFYTVLWIVRINVELVADKIPEPDQPVSELKLMLSHSFLRPKPKQILNLQSD